MVSASGAWTELYRTIREYYPNTEKQTQKRNLNDDTKCCINPSEENRPCTPMGDVRTEHFMYLTKEEWFRHQQTNKQKI